jgi:hypothetical protein
MNIRPLAIFAAGAIFATALVGTTTWLQASSENTITACANKKTGAMRYLSKGKCNKKTESQVSWNSTGVAGTQGVPGPKGDTGAKGDSGPKGEDGTKAMVVDSTGKELGVWAWTNYVGYQVAVDSIGGVWIPEGGRYDFGNETLYYFRDSDCRTPLIRANRSDSLPSPADRWLTRSPEGQLQSGYRTLGTSRPFSGATLSGVYLRQGLAPFACFNDKNRAGNTLGDYSTLYFWNAEEVPLPTYTPPLSIRVG